MDAEKRRNRRDAMDRNEILERIELHSLALDVRQDREDAVVERGERVTVRSRLRQALGTDEAGGAGDILDYKRLLERFTQTLGEHAHRDVRCAADLQRQHNLNRLFRIFLGVKRRSKGKPYYPAPIRGQGRNL